MPTEDGLSFDLQYIADRTKNAEAVKPPGYFQGGNDTAEELRIYDDNVGGRRDWAHARHYALDGLWALHLGDRDRAEECLRRARDAMLLAYDRVIEPKQIARLGASADIAGRRRKAPDLVERLSAAMAAQPSKSGGAALAAAFQDDPNLKAECDADGRSDDALTAAVRRFRMAKGKSATE